jgi:predicted transposase YdaD
VDCNIATRSIKDIRVYQEGFAEGRLEGLLQAVPRLLDLALTVEQVAEGLGITVEQVQNAKLYYEGFQEGERIGKLKVIPLILAAGLSVEQVATALSLSVEEVQQAAQQQSPS